MRSKLIVAAVVALVGLFPPARGVAEEEDPPCVGSACVELGGGVIHAGNVIDTPGGKLALSEPSATLEWRLMNTCADEDDPLGGCTTQPPCPAGPDRVVGRFLIQNRPIGSEDEGDWASQGIDCVDVTDLQPTVTPEMVQAEFEELPLPLGDITRQPDTEVLVNLGAIFYTTQPDQVPYDVVILGQAVHIDAFIVAYAWDPGDGSAELQGRGAPYPDVANRHVYATTGGYQVTLTLTWDATYTIEGGPQTPVLDTTTTTSAPVPVTVVAAESILVDRFD